MRRGCKKDPREYIEMRIGQLMEDRKKENDSLNRQWLWRIISELKYVEAMMNENNDTPQSLSLDRLQTKKSEKAAWLEERLKEMNKDTQD
jgi:hypothetical protein